MVHDRGLVVILNKARPARQLKVHMSILLAVLQQACWALHFETHVFHSTNYFVYNLVSYNLFASCADPQLHKPESSFEIRAAFVMMYRPRPSNGS